MKVISRNPVSGDFEAFFQAILIFIKSPSGVNKKICGSVVEKVLELDDDLKVLEPERKTLPSIDDVFYSSLRETSLDDVTPDSGFLAISRILPKDVEKRKSFHVGAVYENKSKKFRFFRLATENEEPGLLPRFPYQVSLVGESLEVWADLEPDYETQEDQVRSITWIENVLVPKLSKWMKPQESPKLKALGLIDVEEYSQEYARLKSKYGPRLLQMWPECTDPQKYVYEDVAIASYLILLWKDRGRGEPQKFVDLGCGNGLLVFILSSEGHEGLGIDLRKRKIWDMYPDSTKLEVQTITPSANGLFPEADWVIGNHSDELSPWIPVVAARSSPKTNFFLLPCCAFEFSGEKFSRRKTSRSVYEDFLDYAKEISEVCGFEVDVDRLKIPSTKRIAIVSRERRPVRPERIQEFIDQHSRTDFKPREAVERVKNCSQIDKDVQKTIVSRVVEELLRKKRFSEDFPGWNVGGSLALSDAIKLVPEDLKKALKSECGGLQTLLRNNHSIFEVQKGSVQIRKPVSLQERLQQSKGLKLKEVACWFFLHHPDGCPLPAESCSYKH